MSLTPTQRLSVARIDRDRQKLHNIAFRRLRGAARAGSDVADAVRRPAIIAGLLGVKRVVLEAQAKLRVDVRGAAGHQLSAADGERDTGDIRTLLNDLRLSDATFLRIQGRADAMAERAAGEFRRVADKRRETVMLDRRPRPAGGNVAGLLEPATQPGVFGRFGRANVPDSLIDTWAEAIAYAMYEGGRRDARDEYPAVAESLWGYSWSSILDSRTTVGCKRLDGWVAPIGDTWMAALAPPRHWHCRAVLVEVWQSSLLKPPVPIPPKATEAALQLFLREKEDFLRRVA